MNMNLGKLFMHSCMEALAWSRESAFVSSRRNGSGERAIPCAISGPGEFAHKSLGKICRQTVTRLL
jgi:hypothetical protein